jgi:hypothetical protein
LWAVQERPGDYVVKVAETSVDTYVAKTQRDRNVTFGVHATANNRLIGYTLATRPASGDRPDVVYGHHYLGCFYSRLRDLQTRSDRTIEVLYHDQHVRLLSFGSKMAARDYLLVLRNRSS